MNNNQENKTAYSSLDKEGWVECQHYLVKKKYSPGSTFIDPDELGKSTRNLEEDFRQSGCEADLDQFVVLEI